MTLINLLPHRAAAKKKHRDLFQRQLGYSVFLGCLLAFAAHLLIQRKLMEQQQRNQTLVSDTALLDKKIKDMLAMQKDEQALLLRQHAVEGLQIERHTPVHLMSELVKQLPEGLFITSLRMDSKGVTLKGTSPSSEKVADFLQNMSTDSAHFQSSELLEVVTDSPGRTSAPTPFSARKVANFSLRLHSKGPNLPTAKPSLPLQSIEANTP